MGILLLVIGAGVIAFSAIHTNQFLPWIIAIFAIVSGAFSIFEATIGWCAARAVGIKTKY
jgi:uncharacterized membrane protein HdeD (DUF308 family)